MSAEGFLLLEVHTATRRYLVPRTHLDALAQVASGGDAPRLAGVAAALTKPGQPIVVRELGPLLDPADLGTPGRRHALAVTLRRRTVALLVERADLHDTLGVVQPLGAILARRLIWPWALGAVVIGEEPVVVLDLRRIAADVARGALSASARA